MKSSGGSVQGAAHGFEGRGDESRIATTLEDNRRAE
jgi:hypothetical protein